MEYRDFALKIEPLSRDGYPVLVLESPAGQGRGLLELPADWLASRESPNDWRWVDDDRGHDALREVRKAGDRPDQLEWAKRIGGDLFEALFHGEVRALFEHSLGSTESRPQTGLRIRIHLDPSDPGLARLSALPWEFLYRASTREFLNLNRATPVVRFLDLPRPGLPLELRPPLGILIAGSAPRGSRPLELELERRKIVDAWKRLHPEASPAVAIELLEHTTPAALRSALLDGDFQVLHFMGHGGFSEKTGTGTLMLETERGERFMIPGGALGDLLKGLDTLRAVVLNACHTARLSEDGTNPFASVATALVMAGLPAVVAMQTRLSDGAAITFAANLYSRLAAGDPIDAAVNEARLALAVQQPESVEWATPVLFLRSPGSRLTADDDSQDRQSPTSRSAPGPTAQRQPFMAEEPPADFVERPRAFEPLIDFLLDSRPAEAVALRGAGGYGKTTLARAVCHAPRVRKAFTDGILWVTLGERPRDPIGQLEDLIYLLSGEHPGFSTLDAAMAHWAERIAPRRMLIVIDDVWNRAHLTPFLHGGPECVRLVTTRDRTVLPAGARVVTLEAMHREEALALLTAGLPAGNRAACRRLAARLGHWPLLLRLVNGVVRDRIEHQDQAAAEALIYVFAALDRRGLTAFDIKNPTARHQAVATTLEVSLDQLDPEERRCFGELAIFQEDVDVPLATLAHLWQGLDRFEIESLCVRFHQLSLLLTTDLKERFIRLHDVIRAYLVQRGGAGLAAVHGRFLRAYRAGERAERFECWRDMPHEEQYLWRHLAIHLADAGQHAELVDTVKDPGFLATRVHLGDLHGAEGDVVTAERMVADDRELMRLRVAFANVKHVLLRCQGLEETAATLLSRLEGDSVLAGVVAVGEQWLSRPHLRPRFPMPDGPDPALVRTLAGHEDELVACALSADGSRVLSASTDGEIRVWDTHAGHEWLRLHESSDEWPGCALSADGTVAVTAVGGRVSVWNLDAGVERHRLTADLGPVSGCAVSADGRVGACLWRNGAIKVWELAGGTERWSANLTAGSLGGCALNGDGTVLLTTSGDVLHVWDGQGRQVHVLRGHQETVESCALSVDGKLALSASDDCTLRLWNTASGRELRFFQVGSSIVSACALSPGGHFAVSGDYDGRIKLWDPHGDRLPQTLAGHAGPVEACAVDTCGRLMASGGSDFTVKLWDRDLVKPDPAAPFRGDFMDCALSADGTLLILASMDATLRCWDTRAGREIRVLRGHDMGVAGCAVSADGSLVFSASQDGSARMWEVATGREIAVFVPRGPALHACALSADGNVFVTAARDGKLKILDVGTREERYTLDAGAAVLCGCALSPDGRRIVVASRDDLLRVWDTAISLDPRFFAGHEDEVNDCAISPDGTWIASASNDQTLRIWDVEEARSLRVLSGHEGPVRGCAISPDGALVVSAGADPFGGSVKVWDALSGRCLVSLRLDGELNRCRWFPDGSGVVVVGEKGLYILDFLKQGDL